MKVYLIRHSEPTYEQVTTAGLTGFGRELGSLTDRGIMLAQQCAQQPLFAQVQLILSSPYTRALQTALEIVRFNDIPLKVELGLHEWLPDDTGVGLIPMSKRPRPTSSIDNTPASAPPLVPAPMNQQLK